MICIGKAADKNEAVPKNKRNEDLRAFEYEMVISEISSSLQTTGLPDERAMRRCKMECRFRGK
jgi:hypothetical protein